MALYVACVIFAEWPLDAHRMTLGRCPGQILNKEVEQMKRSLVGRGMRFPFVLITFFFFLWGFARAVLDILNPFFQQALDLSKTQAAGIQFVTYVAYFMMAVPAGRFIRRYGTRRGVLLGLILFGLGAMGFSLGGLGTSATAAFGILLVMLFMSGCGLATLEVAANPYVTLLGDPLTAAGRLNRAQAFNGAGCIGGSLLGGIYCFGAPRADVSVPYLIIGGVVLAVAVVFSRIRLPEVIMAEASGEAVSTGGLRRQHMFMFGLGALFCYEIAEIAINSFFVNYAVESDWVGWAVRMLPGVSGHLVAAMALSVGLLLFMGGRLLGSWVMQYVAAERVLLFCASCAVVLTVVVMMDWPVVSFAASWLIFVVESIMFPTIFALSIRGLGPLTQRGSAILMMTPVGGAVGTVLMGMAADLSGMTWAFVVPLAAYVVVLAYALALQRSKAQS